MKPGDRLSLVGGPPRGLALVNLRGLDIRVSATLWRSSLLRHDAATCVPCIYRRETVSGKAWKSLSSFGAVSNALEAWELGNPKRRGFLRRACCVCCCSCNPMGRRNKGKAVKEGAHMGNDDGVQAMAVEGEAAVSPSAPTAPEPLIAAIRIDGEEVATGSDQTSADYYFDSYAHFGESTL